jgi:hypothetical protein
MKVEMDCKNVHVGTISIDEVEEGPHRIKFFEVKEDRETYTGKTVTVTASGWKSCLDCSNAIVTFFEELSIKHPEIANTLMEKYSIMYREGDGTP